MRLSAVGLPPYRIFTLEEIEDATNSFDPSNLIGEGSQGGQVKNSHGITINNSICHFIMVYFRLYSILTWSPQSRDQSFKI